MGKFLCAWVQCYLQCEAWLLTRGPQTKARGVVLIPDKPIMTDVVKHRCSGFAMLKFGAG